MTRTTTSIAACLALAATLVAAPARAQNARSFVSGHGLDTNACTLAAPCRTFAVAFTHTNAGGEIDVLDTAGYGPLTIDKAISIVNDGSIASVLVPSGSNGITINAGPSDAVSLRGLTIEGAGAGANGIQFNTGHSLAIENCAIRHFNNSGIAFFSNASSSLLVASTLVADNSGAGIFLDPSGSGTYTAVFNRVESNSNSTGMILTGSDSTGTVNATVAESVMANNASAGIFASTFSGRSPIEVMVFRSVAASNGNGSFGSGIDVEGTGAKLQIGQSAVTSNTFGWTVSMGGVLQSYGDNKIDGNGSSEGAPPAIPNK
jgi:Right handed beta helix region